MQEGAQLASDPLRARGVGQTTALTCSPLDRLGEAAARLLASGRSHALVTADDAPERAVGWLSDRDVVYAVARDPGALRELRVRSAMTACACCPEDASLLAVLERMRSAATDRVVRVSREGRCVGVVTLGGLARLAAREGAAAMPRLGHGICELLAGRSRGLGGSLADEVRDVMTPEPTACRADDPLLPVLQRFYASDVSCLPVLRGDGRLAGMLGARDLCRTLLGDGAGPASPLPGVTGKAVSCWPEDSLEAAEAIMRAYRVRRLPVVEWHGRLEGVLSLSDVARAIVSDESSGFPRGRAADLVETLAAVVGDE